MKAPKFREVSADEPEAPAASASATKPVRRCLLEERDVPRLAREHAGELVAEDAIDGGVLR